MIVLGVLISGSGTNLQAIIDAIDAGRLDARIALVISSRPDAYGLKRAAAAGIETISLSQSFYADALMADVLIAQELVQRGVEYVVMAGYMRMVRRPLLEAFENRIINLHPALLPAFAGANGIGDAFDYGVKLTGVTVHFANAVYDAGPIIAQRAVAIEPDDDRESLAERIHAVEHQLLPEVLQLVAEGRVKITADGKVSVS